MASSQDVEDSRSASPYSRSITAAGKQVANSIYPHFYYQTASTRQVLLLSVTMEHVNESVPRTI